MKGNSERTIPFKITRRSQRSIAIPACALRGPWHFGSALKTIDRAFETIVSKSWQYQVILIRSRSHTHSRAARFSHGSLSRSLISMMVKSDVPSS
jgi:hypothetical protein